MLNNSTPRMTAADLAAILACGEDSRHQFKRDFTNTESLAAELAAFANLGGGMLLVGVGDDGKVTGLTLGGISRLNQLLSNTASQHVKPPINPTTSNIQTEQGLVMLIDVPEGLNKPYVDAHGRIWVKTGADKRQVTAREEMQRMFQQAGLLHADEQSVAFANLDNIDQAEFAKYFDRRYKKPVASTGMPLEQLLQNLNLARDGKPNLAGMLLFGSTPHIYLPAFIVKAVAFPGTVLHDTRYLDNENIEGTLAQQYQRCMSFLGRNLHHVQGNRGFNSPGQLEIPHHVLEEIMVNALVHRDYLISAPIRLLIFADRVEIISPGHLPNHLDTHQIRFGLSNLRNPGLASHAFHILPYQGLGSGIPRALEDWPQIEFADERDANQFRVTLKRPDVQSGAVNGGANDKTSEKTSEKTSVKTSEKVFSALQTGPESTIAQLAAQVGVTTRTIERALSKLQQDNRVTRIGPDKGGHWKVTHQS